MWLTVILLNKLTAFLTSLTAFLVSCVFSEDVVFYEVALSKDDAYLVTGDKKHFPQEAIVVPPSGDAVDTECRRD